MSGPKSTVEDPAAETAEERRPGLPLAEVLVKRRRALDEELDALI